MWDATPPNPTNPDLLEGIRDYLISLGLVREPRDGTHQGVWPTCWIAPRFGVPAPGQTEGLKDVEAELLPDQSHPNRPGIVVALNPMTDIPPQRYEGWMRSQQVEFVFRGRTPKPILALENAIRASINDKRGWMMGAVPVIESLLFSGLQPIGADKIAYNFRCEYTFQIETTFVPIS